MQDITPCDVLIHEYQACAPSQFDEDGELLLGSYYQFINEAGQPVGPLVGPHFDNEDAEAAAVKAFKRRDF